MECGQKRPSESADGFSLLLVEAANFNINDHALLMQILQYQKELELEMVTVVFAWSST